MPFYAQTSDRVHTLTCLPDLVIIGLLMISSSESSSVPPGGGGTPHNGLYRETSPERGTFFRLQVYERAGISQAEVYERVEKSVIRYLKGPLIKIFRVDEPYVCVILIY